MSATWKFVGLECPITGAPLTLVETPGSFHAMSSGGGGTPVGPTDTVLVTSDGQYAYPVVAGIPVLLPPERLAAEPGQATGISVDKPPYAEAYQERELYSQLALNHGADLALAQRLRKQFEAAAPETFPEPPEAWHSGGSTASAYAAAMRHLAPMADRKVLQIGGLGTHALKLLHAGAATATVVSPVMQELVQGADLAEELGFTERVRFICAIAEHLPLPDGSIDRIYSGSSMHHTVTASSFAEAARVLSADGRFASVDVWRSGRLYDLGIRVFGKRHGNSFCHALDAERIEPVRQAFSKVETSYHGAVARYALAVSERVGRQSSPKLTQKVTDWEDRLATRVPVISRTMSSLVVVRGRK